MSWVSSVPAQVSDDCVSVSSNAVESVVSDVSSITMEPSLLEHPSKFCVKPVTFFSPPNKSRGSAKKRQSTQISSDSSNGTSPVLEKRKDTLRKGKWIPEEELYTNKVIEYFNAGLLKLDGADKNVTLRSYLSEKLQCDPMRITKKFTGAACLGKRVYHFDRNIVAGEDVDKAMKELDTLEQDFRTKLEQSNKKRSLEESVVRYDESLMVSTPAIDALVKRHRAEKETRSVVPTLASSSTAATTTTVSSSANSGAAMHPEAMRGGEQHMRFILPLPPHVIQQQQILYFQKLQQMHAVQTSTAVPAGSPALQLKFLQELAMMNRAISIPR